MGLAAPTILELADLDELRLVAKRSRTLLSRFCCDSQEVLVTVNCHLALKKPGPLKSGQTLPYLLMRDAR